MNILLISLAPVLIIIFYIYLRDKYEREPVKLLVRAVLLGGLIVIPIIFLERLLAGIMPPAGPVGEAMYYAFVVAGTSEELIKFLALYLLIWKSPSFNEKFDGIVYAVCISLGFAGVENVMYVMEGGYQTALMRGITAVPAHALFGITMGYYFGLARMYPELRGAYLLKSLVIPILLHGVYDFLLMVQQEWLLLVFAAYLTYLYITGFRKMKITSDSSVFRPAEDENLKNLLP
ncbi:MAG TPA: PrsW family intramembrane metalloprotease [Bacteroides sp.]|nr:PrsW family intramembrane metalloprotease [Bacteroides sp.]